MMMKSGLDFEIQRAPLEIPAKPSGYDRLIQLFWPDFFLHWATATLTIKNTKVRSF
jgi:hypothetical protein